MIKIFWIYLLVQWAVYCNTMFYDQFQKLFKGLQRDDTDPAGNILRYPICVTDNECVSPFGKCVAPICLRTCQHIILCSKDEYCNKTSGVCIPKLLRRRYTNTCDEMSHCLKGEVCLRKKCVRNVDTCTKHENCRHDGFCSDGICLDCLSEEECEQHASCRLSTCYSKHLTCTTESDCTEEKQCFLGRCIEKTCSTPEDCGGYLECINGECGKVVCSDGTDCKSEEECLDGFCVNVQLMMLEKICSNDGHCLAEEKCEKGKCLLSLDNEKVLPKNFICDCADNEECSLKSCRAPPGMKSEVNTKKSKGLKEIVKELLREEERNIVSEISRKKLSNNPNNPNEVSSKKMMARNKEGVVGVFENFDDLTDIKTVYAESCSPEKQCFIGKCCVQGVCIEAANCSTDISNRRRELIPIYDIKESSIECATDFQCRSKESCHVGICHPKTIFQRQLKCSTNADCGGKKECFFGICTGVVDLATDDELFPCFYYAGNGTSYCKDKRRTCLMNSCIFL